LKQFPRGSIKLVGAKDMALDRNRLVKPVKKLQKLVKKIDIEPAPDKVHALRTNTRRVEAMYHALSPGRHRTVLKDLERVRKRAGKVRDMDVLTGYASTVDLSGEEQECAVRLLEYLGAQRRKFAKKLHNEVAGLRPALSKEFRRAPARFAKLTRNNGSGRRKGAVPADAVAAAVTLAVHLADPRSLSRQTLHAYRLKVKELRNVLEMATGGGSQKFVSDLGEVKDAIGEWHDWQELVSIAEKVLNHGNRCEVVAELKRIADRKYERALTVAQNLRTEYLRNAPAPKKSAASASPDIPREAAWEAIALLVA
jgi:CHAD domain-containing protein